MDKDLANRLEKIEITLAHLERQYEQVNEVVIAQGKAIARIESHLRRMGQTLEQIELDRIKGTSSKPPHYQ